MIELVDIVDQHRRPLELELIKVGLRLRWWPSEQLSWSDLAAVAMQPHPDSLLYAALNPDGVQRHDNSLLLREIEYNTKVASWAACGGEGDPPERFRWPAEPEEEQSSAGDVDAYELEDFDAKFEEVRKEAQRGN